MIARGQETHQPTTTRWFHHVVSRPPLMSIYRKKPFDIGLLILRDCAYPHMEQVVKETLPSMRIPLVILIISNFLSDYLNHFSIFFDCFPTSGATTTKNRPSIGNIIKQIPFIPTKQQTADIFTKGFQKLGMLNIFEQTWGGVLRSAKICNDLIYWDRIYYDLILDILPYLMW